MSISKEYQDAWLVHNDACQRFRKACDDHMAGTITDAQHTNEWNLFRKATAEYDIAFNKEALREEA